MTTTSLFGNTGGAFCQQKFPALTRTTSTMPPTGLFSAPQTN